MKNDFIIQEVKFDVDFSSRSKAHNLQNALSKLYNERWHYVMQDFFEECISPHTRLQIDSIILDLGAVPYDNLEDAVTKALLDALASAFVKHAGYDGPLPGNGNETALATGKLDILLYFFTSGLLPWWTSMDLLRDINMLVEEQLIQQPEMLTQMIRKAGKIAAARKRLVEHVHSPALKNLISQMVPGEGNFINEYHDNVVAVNEKEQVIKSESKVVSKALWEIILAFLIEGHGSNFNRKEFTKSTLRSMAAHFGVHYDDLLLLLINQTSLSRAREQLPLLHVLHEIADELVFVQPLIEIQGVAHKWKFVFSENKKLLQDAHVLLYFLMNGSLPNEVGHVTKGQLFGTLRTMLNKYPATLQTMLRGLSGNAQLFERFSWLAADKTVGMLLRLFQPASAIALRDILIQKDRLLAETGSSLSGFLHGETFDYLLRNPVIEMHVFDQHLQQKMDTFLSVKDNIAVADEVAEDEEKKAISSYDLVIFFLREGVLPWWAEGLNPIEALNILIAENKLQARTVLVFAGTTQTMRERLLLHFPLATLAELFKLLPSSASALEALDSVVQLVGVLKVRSSQTALPILYQILWLNYIDFRYETWSSRLFFLQSITWIISKDAGKSYVRTLYLLADIMNNADGDALSAFKEVTKQITEYGFVSYSINDSSLVKHLLNNIQYAFALQPALYRLETAGLIEMFFPGIAKEQPNAILGVHTNSGILLQLLKMIYASHSNAFYALKTALLSYPVLLNKLKTDLLLHNEKLLLAELEPERKNTQGVVVLDIRKELNNTDCWPIEKWQSHFDKLNEDSSIVKSQIGDILEYILTWSALPPSVRNVQFHQLALQAVMFLYVNDRARLQQLLTASTALSSVRLQLFHLFKDAELPGANNVASFLEQYTAYDKWKYARTLTFDKSIDSDQNKKVFDRTIENVDSKDKAAEILKFFLNNDQSSFSVSNDEGVELINAMDLLLQQDKELLDNMLASSSINSLLKMQLHLLAEKFQHAHHELFAFINKNYEKDLIAWVQQTPGFEGVKAETSSQLVEELLSQGGIDQVKKFLQVTGSAAQIMNVFSVKVPLDKLEGVVLSVYQKWGEDAIKNIRAMNTMLLALSAEINEESRMQFLLKKFYLEWLSGKRNIYDIKSFIRNILEDDGIRSILHGLSKKAMASAINIQFKGEYIKEMIRQKVGVESGNNFLSDFEGADVPENLLKKNMQSKQLHQLLSQQLNAEQKVIDEKNKALLRQGDVSKIYINNAGLVLLQPFVPFYFQLLGLTENNVFVDDTSRYRAALLTQYLVTGQTEIAEFDLPLNKILCAINFEEVVPPFLDLSEEEIRVSEELFKTLFQRWDKMKNSSAENFRNAFMQRHGSLIKMQDGWTLKVEQRGYDVLLETLPWSYRMIKFKWMDKPLYVEWI